MRKLIIAITLSLTVAVLFFGCNQPSSRPQPNEVEAGPGTQEENLGTAPDFSLPTPEGKILKLSDFKGKVIILNFWSLSCPSCHLEIADFIKLSDAYREQGLVIVGVNLDFGRGPVRQFLKKAGVNYPVVMADKKVIGDYGGMRYIPTTFIIDRNANIRKQYIGYTSYEVFESEVKALLEGDEDGSK